MSELSEFAPAKINLTLEVLGKRPDGNHEIRSLVAFAASAGDKLTALRQRDGRLHVTGPFAAQLSGRNLVDTAILALRSIAPAFAFAAITLEKNLPVASGIGGGSADAAAALRLAARDCSIISESSLRAIAPRLGADVPVCLLSNAALMTGRGETVTPSRMPAAIYAVLANPLVKVPVNKTALVFERLKAPPFRGTTQSNDAPLFFAVPDVIDYAQQRGNSLEKVARELFPAVSRVASELSRLEGCRLAQLSGAGPTCFGIFASRDEAVAGAQDLSARHPDWWVKPSRLI